MKRKELTGVFVCFALLFFAAYVFAAPVPDTGQTKCYDVAGSVITCPTPGQALYGQDANYTINPPASAYASGLANSPWPMIGHDPQHTGQSQYQGFGYPISKWQYRVGYFFYSSPVIASDGTVYVGSNSADLCAINPDGTLKWVVSTGSHLYSSPAIGSDGTVYVGAFESWNYGIYLNAINPDGTLKWHHPMGSCYSGNCSLASSPSIGTDGMVYVGSDFELRAIDPDGTRKWGYVTGNVVSSSPSIGSDGTVYVGSIDKYLYAIKPDGTLKWRYQTGDSIYKSPSIGSDGTVYVGSFDKYLYAIKPDGTLKWRYQIGGTVRSQAIGSDGTVYVGAYDDKYLYAIKPDGTLKWRYQMGDSVNFPAIGSDGTIYVESWDRHLYAIKPDGTLKWRYQILVDNNTDHSPSIGSDGTIYVGSGDGYLYALGLPIGKGAIFGYVKDLSTDNAIAAVLVSTTDASTQTNIDGSYAIVLYPGVYDITFSKTNYQTITIKNVVVDVGKATELNEYLTTPGGTLNFVSTSSSFPPAETGVLYDTRVRISGGVYPYIFTKVTGSLPSGLSLDPAYGNITGTPTTPGSYMFAIGVTDSTKAYAERDFGIEVTGKLWITTASPLVRGTVGVSYFQSFQAGGGKQPYSFSKSAGSLPPSGPFGTGGLSLSSGVMKIMLTQPPLIDPTFVPFSFHC